MDGWLIHGGRLEAARAAWPEAPQPWLDLSTGINPRPWPIERAGEIDWHRLPGEAALARLEGAAADAFGISSDWVCAVPGSEIALRLLSTLGLPGPVRYQAPGYRTHAEAFAIAAPVPPDALGQEAERGGTILLANPANPDGFVHQAAVLVALADSLTRRGGQLIVDEAFADATPGVSLIPHMAHGEAVGAVVLRSFGKMFGLAGVRLGLVVAAPEWLAGLRRRLGSWPVSAAAIAIGTAAYGNAQWIAETRSRLVEDCDRLDDVLRSHGLHPEGHSPLFRLLRTPGADALFRRLARQGILTRPFDYAPDWLRIGLPGDREALARLDRALGHG